MAREPDRGREAGSLETRSPWLQKLSIVHEAYYLLTGIWPVLDRRSFEKVTGPKVDFWLVRTIGGVLGVIGAVLFLAGLRRRVSPEITLLGAGSSASLAASDLVYSSRGRISPVYAAEAVVEVFLAGLWLAGWVRTQK